jgi:hypothetical protein
MKGGVQSQTGSPPDSRHVPWPVQVTPSQGLEPLTTQSGGGPTGWYPEKQAQ